MSPASPAAFQRMLATYCRTRLAPHLPPKELESLESFLLKALLEDRSVLLGARNEVLSQVALRTRIPAATVISLRPHIDAIVDAICREPQILSEKAKFQRLTEEPNLRVRKQAKTAVSDPADAALKKKRGQKPKPIAQYPVARFELEVEPVVFADALREQMRRHGDTSWHLQKVLSAAGLAVDRTTLSAWRRGFKAPKDERSLAILRFIERRYKLPAGYFRERFPHPGRASTGFNASGIGPAERRRLAWHLPDDFMQRPVAEQEEVLSWARRVIITGSTEYRRYQAAAQKTRFGIRFPSTDGMRRVPTTAPSSDEDEDDVVLELNSGRIDAPPRLAAEMANLIRFKTSTLADAGLRRNGVWGAETADQKLDHLGLLFGALHAAPTGPVRGLGIGLRHLSFALLAYPAVWDWYLGWREQRRGFFTAWEVDMLRLGLALTRTETGWLRQNRSISKQIAQIPGIIEEEDVQKAADWDQLCDLCFSHLTARVKEVQRVARVHRDPFEPILVVLEAERPLQVYRRIADEIVRLMPDERRYPMAAAEAARALLMVRLGLHLGLRQRNLRDLLYCPKGEEPRTERQLENQRCGELRWSSKENGWEVFIPSKAFKNADSSFFGAKPFRLILPDILDLYGIIDRYCERHRPRLLRGAVDPGTVFVKTVKTASQSASYDQNTFYEAWRLTIQRYGIYNPFTKRGAIPGLLPHGPHNVRDILATHVLKVTGSYEQASYAIQDTPDMVAKHYGRFLPGDKAALAAAVLNKAWT